jgi:hypothetical protein
MKNGFTQFHAERIREHFGYGCKVYDQLSNVIYDVKSKNKKKQIVAIAYDQHAVEFHPLGYGHVPKQVVLCDDLFTKFLEVLDEGPSLIFRHDTKDRLGEKSIFGVVTSKCEYKKLDLPPGEFSLIDKFKNNYHSNYPHNNDERDPSQLEYLRVCDFHMSTIWYGNAGEQVIAYDFNQAYRSAAELKCNIDPLYLNYEFPHFPNAWCYVSDDINEQYQALEHIINNSGFAHLTAPTTSDLIFDNKILQDMNRGRIGFTSPEVLWLLRCNVAFKITAIAFNETKQSIDWEFPAGESADETKNIYKIGLGTLISRSPIKKLYCSREVADYYRGQLGEKLLTFDYIDANDLIPPRCFSDDANALPPRPIVSITYKSVKPEVYTQQYHIHAYILTYMRLALYKLIQNNNVQMSNIVKINCDGLYTREPIDRAMSAEYGGFKLDFKPLGELGAIKFNRERVRGFPSECKKELCAVIPYMGSLDDYIPQRLVLGGCAGSGKTHYFINALKCATAAAYSNVLSNDIKERAPKFAVGTMHNRFGIGFSDKTYEVKKIPKTDCVLLDDITLVPIKMLKNIINALIVAGKRIYITYGPGQCVQNAYKFESLFKFLESRDFVFRHLGKSERMEPQLYKIAEDFRYDERVFQIQAYDKDLYQCEKNIEFLESQPVCMVPNRLKLLNFNRERLYNILTTKKKLTAGLLHDYMKHFNCITWHQLKSSYTCEDYIITSTNKRRESINKILQADGLRKYRVLDRFKNAGKWYFRGELLTAKK